MNYDCIIAGGGLIGSAIAYGLARRGLRIAVLDQGDRAFRAARGNFGLVWVQGKGCDYAPYARWSYDAANLWPAFDAELREASGVDTAYCRPGGMEFCISDAEWQDRSDEMVRVREHTNNDFEYTMLDHAALKKRIPQISSNVVGASYSPHDGHVNPLYLLRALHQQMDAYRVDYLPNRHIQRIEQRGGEFIAHTQQGAFTGGKAVLCAGLDNQRLGRMLDLHIPVSPNRGQLLITERIQPFLHYPTLHVRQTQEGGLQIGTSSESVGLDDRSSGEIMQKIAARAVYMFPQLAGVQLVRAWSALRVMTPDGKPIYQQSQHYPGAFGIACHSGVTLAAVHAGPVAGWISGEAAHPLLEHFSAERFNLNSAVGS